MSDAFAALRLAAAREGCASSDYDLNPGMVLPQGRILRPAGVLMAFTEGPRGLELILSKRSSELRHHPGQIAFPGGKVDPGDGSPVGAALREAEEEVGLDRANVEVLAAFAPHETVTGFAVTPVLARVRRPFTPVAEPGEVAEVFTVPFAHIADPARYRIEARLWRGQLRRYYAVPYGPYYIWGATARMLRALAERVAQ